jgi:hypothetical protein
MMKKRLLLIAGVLFLFVQSHASEPVRWGVMGGMNVSKPSMSESGERIGFHAGAKAEFNLSKAYNGLYISSAVLFSLKGREREYFIYGGGKQKDKESNYFLDIPVHLGYRYAFNDNIALFGSFGPYVGIGLFGKNKIDPAMEHKGYKTTNIYGSKGYLNRFDFGLGLRVGVDLSKKVQFSVGYDLGLKNMAKIREYKNRNYTVSCAYMF